MTKQMSCRQMVKMRLDGYTYQKIADELGVSRQCVHEKLKKYDKKLLGMRGKGFDINTIIYKGFYEHFRDDEYESLTSFEHKVFGGHGHHTFSIKKFIIGEHESRFTVKHIKKMMEVTGKSFDELFELRSD